MVATPGGGGPASPLQIALSRSVVRRALAYAVVVGAVLIAINHGDALARGELGPGRLLKMALTLMVPYAVSTLSSVQALRGRSTLAVEEAREPTGPGTGGQA